MGLEALALLGIGFVGTLIWLISTEAAAIYYGVTLGWPPLVVGVVAALGQCAMYVVLYVAGERLLRRWRWLETRVARVRERYAQRLETGYLASSALGAVFGLPPVIAAPTLAPSFRVPLWRLLPVLFAGRTIRFAVLAGMGGAFAGWFGLG